jgi:hypothetical protein
MTLSSLIWQPRFRYFVFGGLVSGLVIPHQLFAEISRKWRK